MNLDEMYSCVLYLLRNGKVHCADANQDRAPFVHASMGRYNLAFGNDTITLEDDLCLPGKCVMAAIPYESQIGGLLCATFLSEPIDKPPRKHMVWNNKAGEFKPDYIYSPTISSQIRFEMEGDHLTVIATGSWPDNDIDALRLSIKKWQTISAALPQFILDGGTKTCALCKLHFTKDVCLQCPVYRRTGQASCKGTPFEDFHTAMIDRNLVAHRKAAYDEVEFLQELLDAELYEAKAAALDRRTVVDDTIDESLANLGIRDCTDEDIATLRDAMQKIAARHGMTGQQFYPSLSEI